MPHTGTRAGAGSRESSPATWYGSKRDDRLFFREFDDPATNNGIAENSDGDKFYNAFTTLSWRDFTLQGAWVDRTKQIPTAPWGTFFNDNRTESEDGMAYVDLKYDRYFGTGWSVLARANYNYYWYFGDYVYDANGDPLNPDLDINRAASLTCQLPAFGRKRLLELKVVDLNRTIENMDNMVRRLVGEDIVLETIPRDGLGKVRVDPGQIDQVIMNLVVNSRDAMPDGGKLTIETANVSIDGEYARMHTGAKPGEYVMQAVSDTGCGMDEETQSHIFEPFFTTKGVGKGTGLGLSTVYGIMKQTGGNIWVYSEKGKGTTFKIYLPRTLDPEEEQEKRPEVSTVQYRGTETLLVAEDEEIVRDLICTSLREHGYKVLEARNGMEALKVANTHQGSIDMLLTDVVMPGMSGRELADRFVKKHPKGRVLFMSGYTENAIVHHGVLDPGTKFLQKPFRISTLKEKVREVLEHGLEV